MELFGTDKIFLHVNIDTGNIAQGRDGDGIKSLF